MNSVLEEDIEDLAEKLEKLQRSSGTKDFEVKKCSNFDKQTSLLQRRLEKLGGMSDKCVKEIQEIAEASLSINTSCSVGKSSVSSRRCNKFMDVRSPAPLFLYHLTQILLPNLLQKIQNSSLFDISMHVETYIFTLHLESFFYLLFILCLH